MGLMISVLQTFLITRGMGQLNLQNTVMPSHQGNSLSTFYDDGKTLQPSFGLLYELDLDPTSGLDITLTWNDESGSANFKQTQNWSMTLI